MNRLKTFQIASKISYKHVTTTLNYIIPVFLLHILLHCYQVRHCFFFLYFQQTVVILQCLNATFQFSQQIISPYQLCIFGLQVGTTAIKMQHALMELIIRRPCRRFPSIQEWVCTGDWPHVKIRFHNSNLVANHENQSFCLFFSNHHCICTAYDSLLQHRQYAVSHALE